MPSPTKNGIELITAERQRQIESEGWTPQHDDEHDSGEMVLAAIAYADCSETRKTRHQKVVLQSTYAQSVSYTDPWPWDDAWDKRNQHNPIRRLVIAGALIAAEIDRLQRIEETNDAAS